MPSNGSPEYLALLEEIEYNLIEAESTATPDRLWQTFDLMWSQLNTKEEYFDIQLFNIASLAVDLYARINKQSIWDVIKEMRSLHVRKNAGYAGADQPDPWANFRLSTKFGISPADGVLVRLSDKYIRTANLRRDPNNEQVGESLLDSLADFAAYSLIAICLIEEDQQKEQAS